MKYVFYLILILFVTNGFAFLPWDHHLWDVHLNSVIMSPPGMAKKACGPSALREENAHKSCLQKELEDPIDQKSLCLNPAQYLCNLEINPAIEKFFKVIDQHNTTMNTWKSYVENCGGHKRCIKEADSLFINTMGVMGEIDYLDLEVENEDVLTTQPIINSARKKRGKEIFEKSVGKMIDYIEKKYKGKKKEKILNILKKKVKFKLVNDDLDNSGVDKRSMEANYFNGVVSLGGLSFMLDHPELEQNVETILLHEIAHAIDPCSLDADEHFSNFPFSNVTECLAKGASVGSRNNYGAKTGHCPNSKTDIHQATQMNESFAEWLSVEVIENNSQAGSKPDLISQLKMVAPKISHYCALYSIQQQCQIKVGDREAYEATRKNQPDHPLTLDFINRIFMGNQKLREQIGCEQNSFTLKDKEQKPSLEYDSHNVLYCPID